MQAMANNALQQYGQVKTGVTAESASPHRLIQMLYEGALERIATAKGHMQRGETTRKGELIGKAIGIVGGLRDALDMEQGGEVAQNLDALYEYMSRQLLRANVTNDVEPLEEVSRLLRDIKDAWDQIEQPS